MSIVTRSIGGLLGLDHVTFVHSAIPQLNAVPRFKKKSPYRLHVEACQASSALRAALQKPVSQMIYLSGRFFSPTGSPYLQVVFVCGSFISADANEAEP